MNTIKLDLSAGSGLQQTPQPRLNLKTYTSNRELAQDILAHLVADTELKKKHGPNN
jgi:hypothetical protein